MTSNDVDRGEVGEHCNGRALMKYQCVQSGMTL